MIRSCLTALLSHWRRNPVQLFAYLAGLALATALWSGVQAINSEARASYDAAASTLGEGRYDLLLAKPGNSISLDDYVALRRAGWLVSPVIDALFEVMNKAVCIVLAAVYAFNPMVAFAVK